MLLKIILVLKCFVTLRTDYFPFLAVNINLMLVSVADLAESSSASKLANIGFFIWVRSDVIKHFIKIDEDPRAFFILATKESLIANCRSLRWANNQDGKSTWYWNSSGEIDGVKIEFRTLNNLSKWIWMNFDLVNYLFVNFSFKNLFHWFENFFLFYSFWSLRNCWRKFSVCKWNWVESIHYNLIIFEHVL